MIERMIMNQTRCRICIRERVTNNAQHIKSRTVCMLSLLRRRRKHKCVSCFHQLVNHQLYLQSLIDSTMLPFKKSWCQHFRNKLTLSLSNFYFKQYCHSTILFFYFTDSNKKIKPKVPDNHLHYF